MQVQTELGVVLVDPATNGITTYSGTGGNSDLALGYRRIILR